MIRIIVFLSALFSLSALAGTDNAFIVNQQKYDSVKSAKVTPDTEEDAGAHRWTFDAMDSNEHKFIFKLKSNNTTGLVLTCNRKINTISLYLIKDGKEYHPPEFDSVTTYAPNNVLRDSIIVPAGPSVEKIVQFFDDTTSYYIIVDHKILGRFGVGAKASGELGENIEVCRGLTYRD